jgi:hypothetical protein
MKMTKDLVEGCRNNSNNFNFEKVMNELLQNSTDAATNAHHAKASTFARHTKPTVKRAFLPTHETYTAIRSDTERQKRSTNVQHWWRVLI